MNETTEHREPKKEKGSGSEALDWLQCIVSALVAAILIFTFVARTITVVGSSMVPTLEQGHLLIVSKLFYQPNILIISGWTSSGIGSITVNEMPLKGIVGAVPKKSCMNTIKMVVQIAQSV